jgi:hypothetical protein
MKIIVSRLVIAHCQDSPVRAHQARLQVGGDTATVVFGAARRTARGTGLSGASSQAMCEAMVLCKVVMLSTDTSSRRDSARGGVLQPVQ